MKKLTLKELIKKVTKLDTLQQIQIKGGSALVNPLFEANTTTGDNPMS